MSFDPNVMRRAMARLETKRMDLQKERDIVRRTAYEKEPRIALLDRNLRGTMADLIGATLGRTAERSLEDIRMKNLGLQRQRAELLAGIGLAEHALDDLPSCTHCNDTGWRGTVLCDCLQTLCTEEQMKELSKLLGMGNQSFDDFRLDYYSQSFHGNQGVPRENMQAIRDACFNYAQKFGRFPIKNLFLSGAPGLGKTFLSACIARMVSERGYSVVYDTAGNIFSQFEAKKFQQGSQDGREARDETKRYLGCDLLIVDDLGCELTTQFTQSALYELLNTRLVAGRHTVISSNLSMQEVARRYTPQIASRLEGEYHALHFFGDDIRIVKKQQF